MPKNSDRKSSSRSHNMHGGDRSSTSAGRTSSKSRGSRSSSSSSR